MSKIIPYVFPKRKTPPIPTHPVSMDAVRCIMWAIDPEACRVSLKHTGGMWTEDQAQAMHSCSKEGVMMALDTVSQIPNLQADPMVAALDWISRKLLPKVMEQIDRTIQAQEQVPD